MVGQEGPAQLEGSARHAQDLERLPGMEVPHDHGAPELLHGLRVLDEVAEGPHVVLLAAERRRQHPVEIDVDPHVVAVRRFLGHPDGADELAVIAVLGQPRAPRAVLRIGEGRDEHAPGERVEGVRTDEPARVLDERGNPLHEPGLGGVRPHVEDEDLARVEAARPQEAPVVREACVMGLVAAGHGRPVDDLAVARRLGIGVHRDDAVVAIGDALDAERPDVDVVFLSRDLGQEGRLAGLVRGGGPDQPAHHHEDAGQENSEKSRAHVAVMHVPFPSLGSNVDGWVTSTGWTGPGCPPPRACRPCR